VDWAEVMEVVRPGFGASPLPKGIRNPSKASHGERSHLSLLYPTHTRLFKDTGESRDTHTRHKQGHRRPKTKPPATNNPHTTQTGARPTQDSATGKHEQEPNQHNPDQAGHRPPATRKHLNRGPHTTAAPGTCPTQLTQGQGPKPHGDQIRRGRHQQSQHGLRRRLMLRATARRRLVK